VVSESLPKPVASDKRALLNDLLRLNQVRRLVMHPVRGGVHSDDAFEFLRGLKASLGFSQLVLPPPDQLPLPSSLTCTRLPQMSPIGFSANGCALQCRR